MNLSLGHRERINYEMNEQLETFKQIIDIISSIKKYSYWQTLVHKLVPIVITIRISNLEFTDEFDWDMMDASITPVRVFPMSFNLT